MVNFDNYECEGQLSLDDIFPKEEPKFPVLVMGYMDDAYCPKCRYSFEDKETDVERCPVCGIKVDWTPWHNAND